jgi:hypothetical protein
MSKVFVLDTEKRPLEPVHPGRARLLLKEGKAAVYRRYPFVIMLKRPVEAPSPQPLRLKIDPGSKTTGLALVNDQNGEVVWAAELSHRGAEIKQALSTVGTSTPAQLKTAQVVPLLIEACRRGHRRMMLVGKRGFPRGYRRRRKRYFGYQTGDLVRAVVPERYVCRGTHVGRVAVKAKGTFTVTTSRGKVTDIPHRYCHLIGRTDGYNYRFGAKLSLPPTSPKGAPVSPCA